MSPEKRMRMAFIKFDGLAADGTQQWLQMMAANLPKDRFVVDYYDCDAAHDGGDKHFWEKFDEKKYDMVQTGKAGHRTYPHSLTKLPVVEYAGLNPRVDHGRNIACTIHPSQWQRTRWLASGGRLEKSSVIPIPAEPPASSDNFRNALKIPSQALVAGFHQRADNHIFSPIPLQAFARLQSPDRYFVIMGGGQLYRKQAQALGIKRVCFLDHSESPADISKFLNTLDVFAHGRKDGETLATVLAQAMMHGKPCLSHYSRDGANTQPETMGPAGLFARDLDDYTEKLCRLFADSNLRQKLASKAKPHAETHYSIDSCVQKLAQIYEDIFTQAQKLTPLRRAVAYGQSDMGFLYAGILEDPACIAHHVTTGGVPEEFDVQIFRFFLPYIKTMFDVGANTGLYCFVAAHGCPSEARIHAFEPQPDACEIMHKTINLNNWEDRVCVHAMGLGDKPGDLDLHVAGTGSSFDNNFLDHVESPVLRVPVDTLDNQAAQLGIDKLDFIKIDVEGFEQSVLEGAQEVVRKDSPVLLIEIAEHLRGRKYRNLNYAKTLAWLHGFGYSVWKVTDEGTLIEAHEHQSHPHLAMYLCLHEKSHAKLIPEVLNWAKRVKREKSQKLFKSRIGKLLKDPQSVYPFLKKRCQKLGALLHHAQYGRADANEKSNHYPQVHHTVVERHMRLSYDLFLKGARNPRKACERVMEYARQWRIKQFVLPEYKTLALEAYQDKNSEALKKIRTSSRRLYGLEKISDLKSDLEFRAMIWQAICEIYRDGNETNLGTVSTGFRDVFLNCHSHSVLESWVYLMGFYDELSTIQGYAKYVRPGSTAIDVGANVGAHTLSLSSIVGPHGKVHAYEPRALIVERLEANLKLNQAENVVVHAVGVGQKRGQIPFNEEGGNFNQGVGHFDPDSKVVIPITSLDEDLSRIVGGISFIKIDVEGYELQVLQGAREVLAKHRPTIVLEYNSPPWAITDILESCPWPAQVYRLPNNFYEQTSLVRDFGSLQGFNNILVLPNP